MARFVLFGVPYGESCSECPPEDCRLFGSYYADNEGNQLDIRRLPNGNTYYSYLMYPQKGCKFFAEDGRAGSFFGMSLVLENQVITDINKLIRLFQKTYQDHVKDKIIKELPNGNKKFLVFSLSSKDDKLAKEVGQGFIDTMKKNPELNLFSNVKTYNSAQIHQYILNQKLLVK